MQGHNLRQHWRCAGIEFRDKMINAAQLTLTIEIRHEPLKLSICQGLLLNQNEAPAIGDDSSTPASGHSSNSMLPNVWIYAPLDFRKRSQTKCK